MTDIKWQAPPRSATRAVVDWAPIAAALRSRPGEWALVRQNAPHSTDGNSIKTGRLAAFRPAGSFEARTHTVGAGRFDVYARFVGEGGAA